MPWTGLPCGCTEQRSRGCPVGSLFKGRGVQQAAPLSQAQQIPTSQEVSQWQSFSPPVGTGPLAKREARLAWGLLFPTITAVALVVVLPLLAIFWISFKPVELGDLRAPEVMLREDIRGDAAACQPMGHRDGPAHHLSRPRP